MTDEQHVAALREEIRRAGRTSRRVRRAFGWLVRLLCVVPVTLVFALHGSGSARARIVNGIVGLLIGMFLYLWFRGYIGALFAFPILMFRRAQRSALRDRLMALAPHERAEVLLPLRDDPLLDTREFVAPLLHEVGVPTELAPAAAPDVRGDEASPAERAP